MPAGLDREPPSGRNDGRPGRATPRAYLETEHALSRRGDAEDDQPALQKDLPAPAPETCQRRAEALAQHGGGVGSVEPDRRDRRAGYARSPQGDAPYLRPTASDNQRSSEDQPGLMRPTGTAPEVDADTTRRAGGERLATAVGSKVSPDRETSSERRDMHVQGNLPAGDVLHEHIPGGPGEGELRAEVEHRRGEPQPRDPFAGQGGGERRVGVALDRNLNSRRVRTDAAMPSSPPPASMETRPAPSPRAPPRAQRRSPRTAPLPPPLSVPSTRDELRGRLT
jgi:hypothetical protein